MTAKEVCNIYYAKQCHICPIRPECVSKIGPSSEGLKQWTDKVEHAASKIKGVA